MTTLAVMTFAMSYVIARWFLRYAAAGSVVDHPNTRSAHEKPTPRGGGVAIVFSFLATLVGLTFVRYVDVTAAVGIGGAVAIVGAVGFVDDHGHVAARWRLLAHAVGAFWLLAYVPTPPGIGFIHTWGVPVPFAYATVAILLVWLINLYNFMDGIDGIASVEAITTTLGGALVCAVAGYPELVPPCIALAAAVMGFMVWNWAPAAMFMGDVGSGAIGVAIGGLALLAAGANESLLFAWAILLGVFVVDSGLTLVRRALRREKLYLAHRHHAYQHAARRLGSHAIISITVVVINLIWLLPIATIAAIGWLSGPLSLLLAYLPLLALATWWRAGVPDVLQPSTEKKSSESEPGCC